MSLSEALKVEMSVVDRIWRDHLVAELDGGLSLLYIDGVMLHERTGGPALSLLSERSLRVRRPEHTLATVDHIVSTDPTSQKASATPFGDSFIERIQAETRAHGIQLFDRSDPRRGIVHTLSLESGLALPGTTIACPDSHTSTVGAVGALGLAVGASECAAVLGTRCLIGRRPGTLRTHLSGQFVLGVFAKDASLAFLAKVGPGGGDGLVVEYAGSAAAELPIEARMTLCNMAVECGAESALFPPDEVALNYLRGRRFAPCGEDWDALTTYLAQLRNYTGSRYASEIAVNLSSLEPQITWGTHPTDAIAIHDPVPEPVATTGVSRRGENERALSYMALQPGIQLSGLPIQAAFIGSCSNGGLDDIRAAAAVLVGRRVASGVRALCVPASMTIRRAAEAEGLHQIFIDAGFEWRLAGCSMCIAVGDAPFEKGARVVSSSNRNFENRQGAGVKTHLASPATVAASAVAGQICDPRELLRSG